MKIEINLVSTEFQAAYLAATMHSIKTGEGVLMFITPEEKMGFMTTGCYQNLVKLPQFKNLVRSVTEIR